MQKQQQSHCELWQLINHSQIHVKNRFRIFFRLKALNTTRKRIIQANNRWSLPNELCAPTEDRKKKKKRRREKSIFKLILRGHWIERHATHTHTHSLVLLLLKFLLFVWKMKIFLLCCCWLTPRWLIVRTENLRYFFFALTYGQTYICERKWIYYSLQNWVNLYYLLCMKWICELVCITLNCNWNGLLSRWNFQIEMCTWDYMEPYLAPNHFHKEQCTKYAQEGVHFTIS